MTEDLSTNPQSISPSIEKGSVSLLKVIDFETTKDGIIYYFQPFKKAVIIRCLESINILDLHLSFSFIQANSNSLLIRTNIVNPLYFSKGKTTIKIEGREYKIYGVGDYFAQVHEILD